MKRSRKLISAILIVVVIMSSLCIGASAKSVNLSGYKYYKEYKCTTFMTGTLTSNWNSVTFTGKTGGEYKGSTKPTYVTQNDVIETTGIGSVSIGNQAAGSSAEVSGSTTVVTYKSPKNSKSITAYPTYIGKCSLLTFWVRVSGYTVYQFGSTYVTVHTGDATITS